VTYVLAEQTTSLVPDAPSPLAEHVTPHLAVTMRNMQSCCQRTPRDTLDALYKSTLITNLSGTVE